MAKFDRAKLLANSELLGRLTADELDVLLAHARIERRKAQETIFAKGDPGSGMIAVLSGRLKICAISSEGREIVFNFINPGEVCGEIALLDGKERTADVVAMSDVELLVIERRDFLPFLRSHPEACIRLMGVLCERLRRTSEQVEDVLFRALPSRLAKTLLQLAGRYGKPTPAGRRIDLKLSQRELGNLIGLSRESINKQLNEWERERLLVQEETGIVLTDEEALRRLAELD